MRRPRPHVVGARGALHLPFGFAAKPSPSAPWARGLLSTFSERGSLDLPACGVAQGVAQHGPSTSTQHSRPSRGAKPHGGDDTRPPQGRPHQASSRGGGEIKAMGTSRGAHDASHDDQDQAGASLRCVLVCPLVQREQAQARASSKGIHFGATRPRPSQRQEGSHRGAQEGVTTRAFGRRGPTLVRIGVPVVPLQNGQLLAPFPLNIWEEAHGLCL